MATIRLTLMKTLLLCLIALVSILGCGGGGGGGGSGSEQLFNVTIENTASSAISSADGPVPVILSTAVLAVHTGTSPLLQVGDLAGDGGLEAFAEAANNSTLIQTLQSSGEVQLVGVAQTPVGSQSASFLAPGNRYVVTISASPGEMVSLALAFAQANDTLVANSNIGSSLFDSNGAAISGEIPMALYDVGTEVNEPLGSGPNQLLRQSSDTAGTQTSEPIAVQSGPLFPSAASFIRVSFAPAG